MVHNSYKKRAGLSKGFTLIETLITAGIVLIILPSVYYGYEKILKEKRLDYFTTELTGIIEETQFKAMTHGAVMTILIDNTKHQILVSQGISIVKVVPVNPEIKVEKITQELKLTIYSNGHFLGAGKWRIRLDDKSRVMVFNVGEGRFYVQG